MTPFSDIDFRNGKTVGILTVFAVLFLVLILVSIFALKQPVVMVCVVFVLQVAIGVFLHHAQIWIHAVVALIELICGIAISQISWILVILLIVIYVATLFALKFMVNSSDIIESDWIDFDL